MGLPHVTSVVRPTSLEEAYDLLINADGAARWLAGGIDIVRQSPSDDTTLIDISALPLHDITPEQEGRVVSIGAAVTLTELMESPLIAPLHHGELVSMFAGVASPLLRNLATLGGSLGSCHPWSDIHTLLLALGAHVEVYDGSYHTVDLADVAPQRSVSRALYTRILIPVPNGNQAASFEKFARTKFDVALLNCACCISIDAGRVESARVVAGGTPARAARIQAAEARLLDTNLDDAAIRHAADAAADEPGLREDVRASAEYRRVLLKTGIRRCLLRVRSRTDLGSGSLTERGVS